MGFSRIGTMVAVTMFLSGCAGMQPNQSVKRLESQVALLDQRVGQLEGRDSGNQLAQPIDSLFDTTLALESTVETIEEATPTTASIKRSSSKNIHQALNQRSPAGSSKCRILSGVR